MIKRKKVWHFIKQRKQTRLPWSAQSEPSAPRRAQALTPFETSCALRWSNPRHFSLTVGSASPFIYHFSFFSIFLRFAAQFRACNSLLSNTWGYASCFIPVRFSTACYMNTVKQRLLTISSTNTIFAISTWTSKSLLQFDRRHPETVKWQQTLCLWVCEFFWFLVSELGLEHSPPCNVDVYSWKHLKLRKTPNPQGFKSVFSLSQNFELLSKQLLV